jgi:hypothetical protein
MIGSAEQLVQPVPHLDFIGSAHHSSVVVSFNSAALLRQYRGPSHHPGPPPPFTMIEESAECTSPGIHRLGPSFLCSGFFQFGCSANIVVRPITSAHHSYSP